MINKKALISVLIVLSLLVIGCKKNSTQANNKPTYEIKQINGLSIQIKEIVELPKTKETGSKLLKVTLEGTNKSPNPQSFDAMQVTVKNSVNQALEIYPSASFGEMLNSGKTANGNMFFIMKEKLLPGTLIYENPDTQDKIEWKIKSIEKDDT